ncbi:MAG TPA: ABC transporter substrate-binding protein [Candidatus Omnitrophota bacterium]|nr:ABC transporter substrate-binding protein [Candidatus Omnitrophota bacterium]
MKMKGMLAAAAVAVMAAAPAFAQQAEVKVGLITTLSGPGSSLGVDVRDAFNLAVKELGGTLGGLKAVVVEGDDQQKPEVAKELATRMVEKDKVHFGTGIIFSNLMLATMPTFARGEAYYVSANAGPSQLAGKQCNPYFFSASYQNDGQHEAMGHYVQAKGFKNVYLMAPNYPAGKDAINGFKRFYAGAVAGEVYTTVNQLDYAAELAALRAAKPDAVFVFYPGGMGINFVKQWEQGGLKGQVPLFGPGFTFSEDTLPAMGDAALGILNTAQWSPDLDNAENRKFVESFAAAYGRLPSVYASQAYDAAKLIDAAIKKAGGKLDDKAALGKGLMAAEFKSVRGPFKFNKNHFPIQDYYLREVVKDAKGRYLNKLKAPVFRDHADAYVGECGM